MKHLAVLILVCLIADGCYSSHSHRSYNSSLPALVQSFSREATMEFDFGDVGHLQPHARQLLREIATAMNLGQNHDSLSIEGHAGRFIIVSASDSLKLAKSEPPAKLDYYPSDQDSISVSERMALAVREYLVQLGVAAEQLKASGFGGSRPAIQYPTDEKSAYEWNLVAQANNRVSLEIKEGH